MNLVFITGDHSFYPVFHYRVYLGSHSSITRRCRCDFKDPYIIDQVCTKLGKLQFELWPCFACCIVPCIFSPATTSCNSRFCIYISLIDQLDISGTFCHELYLVLFAYFGSPYSAKCLDRPGVGTEGSNIYFKGTCTL